MPNLENMSYEQLAELVKSLADDNDNLSAKNKKLRRDCVAFAKRLKNIEDSGILNEDIDGLKDANESMKKEMDSLRAQIMEANLSFPVDEPTEELPKLNRNFYEEELANTAPVTMKSNTFKLRKPVVKVKEEPEPEPVPEYIPEPIPDFVPFNEVPVEPEESVAPTKVGTAKTNKIRKVLSILLIVLLVWFLLSAIFGLFAKNTNMSFLGIRLASVAQEYKGANLDEGKIVLIKTGDPSKAKVNDVVCVKVENGKVFAKVNSVNYSGDTATLLVQNDHGTMMADQSNYIGKATISMNAFGGLVRYASNHTYNYFGFQIALFLLLLGALLLLPNNGGSTAAKGKRPKKLTKDISEEDFII